VSAVDNVGVTSVELRVNGVPVPLDSNRTARLPYADWGYDTLQLTATARDAAGNIGQGTGVSFYRNPDLDYETNPAVPEVSITSPSEAAAVEGLVTITGTAGRQPADDLPDNMPCTSRVDGLTPAARLESPRSTSGRPPLPELVRRRVVLGLAAT